MTTTPVTLDRTAECGPGCVYLDGACRCYHGETATQPEPESVRDLVPPF